MDRCALSVDWPLTHPSIAQEGFFQRTSLASVDAVFLDPLAISHHWSDAVSPNRDGVRRTDPTRDHGLGRTVVAWMRRRREEAEDLLKHGGGILVCRLRAHGEVLEIVSADAPPERVDRYSWLPSAALVDRHHQFSFPANSRFLSRHGEDVVFADSGSPFEEYLRTFAGHIAYDAVYEDLLATPLERFATVLARNRVGDVLAIEIPFEEGRLVLVPPLRGVSPSREATVLLQAIEQAAFRPAYAATPDWLASFALPGEDALVDEVASLVERRDALIEKTKEVQSQLEEKTHFKRILYTRGRFAFRPAVADSFQALGFDVESEADHLVLRCGEGDAIVVAAATPSTVELPPYQHLRDAVDQMMTDGDGYYKGILLVSGSLELDPKRRPRAYSDAVLRGCRGQGFCVLTSYQLFKLVQKALSDSKKASLAAHRRALLECTGEFKEKRTT